jgi:hypothetical protein
MCQLTRPLRNTVDEGIGNLERTSSIQIEVRLMSEQKLEMIRQSKSEWTRHITLHRYVGGPLCWWAFMLVGLYVGGPLCWWAFPGYANATPTAAGNPSMFVKSQL